MSVLVSELHGRSRRVEVVADAAYAIFCQPSRSFTGVFAIDEVILAGQGLRDLSGYSCDPRTPQGDLSVDLFVDEDAVRRAPPMTSVLVPATPKL